MSPDLEAMAVKLALKVVRGWSWDNRENDAALIKELIAALRAKDARIAALEAEVARYAKARPTREKVLEIINIHVPCHPEGTGYNCHLGIKTATEEILALFDPVLEGATPTREELASELMGHAEFGLTNGQNLNGALEAADAILALFDPPGDRP